MNILLTSPISDSPKKVIENGTIQDGINLAQSLGLAQYNLTKYNLEIVKNDPTGSGFTVELNDSGSFRSLIVFDTTESNVLSWVSSNYPDATIQRFQKTQIVLA